MDQLKKGQANFLEKSLCKKLDRQNISSSPILLPILIIDEFLCDISMVMIQCNHHAISSFSIHSTQNISVLAESFSREQNLHNRNITMLTGLK